MVGKLLTILGLLVFVGLAVVSCMAIAASKGNDGSAQPQAAAKPAVDRITIVDYNIFHGMYDEDKQADNFDAFPLRLPLLVKQLASMRPDIIVLQEVAMRPPRGYPDVPRILLAALGPEYKQIFGDDDGDPIGEGNLGQMTLTRLPIVSANNVSVFQRRAVAQVVLQLPHGLLEVYNVHLEGPELIGNQRAEITAVRTVLEPPVPSNNPIILTGDFNSRPGDLAIAEILKRGFVDVEAQTWDVTCAKPGDPGCTRATAPKILNNPKVLQDIRIDYMFARGSVDRDIRVVSAEPFMNAPVKNDKGDLIWVSDHIGIQATLELTTRSQAAAPATPVANPSGVR